MTALFNNTSNISLYTVPFAWAVCLAPRLYSTHLYQKASSRQFDTRAPRSWTKTVMENQSIDSATKDRIFRAESAQQNGFENIGFFASAVVAGNLAGVDTIWLNTLSVGYVISRIVYNLLYINNTTEKLATARTVTFISGIGMTWIMFIMAGYNLRSSPWKI